MGRMDARMSRWGTFWIAAALLVVVVPGTALGNHNSLGADVDIAQADEVDAVGDLRPDVDEVYRQAFHGNLDVPRLAPQDQTGQRYTDCTPWADHEDAASYEAGLRDGTACYVGLLDAQMEYVLLLNPFVTQQWSDALYPFNPAPGDDACQVPGSLTDPRCDGAAHPQRIPGDVAVDTDLLDSPVTQASTEAGTLPDPGSGTVSFPFLLTPYVFLFGQPHPDNAEPSTLRAGEGPFGPSGLQGTVLPPVPADACGQRTRDCRLLTPEDLAGYDRFAPYPDDAGRLCSYRPQFETITPEIELDGCAVGGDRLTFTDTTEAGGFVQEGPPTWVGTLPGWFETVLILHGGEVLAARDVAEATVDQPDAVDALGVGPGSGADGQIDDGILQYVAVNPRVPLGTHPLWCVVPNLLATGDRAVAGAPDPGLYGPYQADAIDADVHPTALLNVHRQTLAAGHGPARAVLSPVEHAIEGDPAAAQRALVDAASALPGPVADALARAGPTEGPAPIETAHAFQVPVQAGVGCTPLGEVEVVPEPTERAGWVVMDARVEGTVALKDPTVTDASGLPADERDTRPGHWTTDAHTFTGHIRGVADTSGDGAPDPCQRDTEHLDPEEDTCTWRPVWDANNPDCQDIAGNPCSKVAEHRGFAEAGLWFVLKITGPVVLHDDSMEGLGFGGIEDIEATAERTRVVGLSDPDAQHCILGIARGFQTTLTELAGGELTSLCGEVDGERVVVLDAMRDQSLTGPPGTYRSAVAWTKAAPTPAALISATGLGGGDELCVHTYIRTQDDGPLTVADGLVLEGEHVFTDCDAAISQAR